MEPSNPKEVVRRGYDALSVRYDEAYGGETKYADWIAELCGRLGAGGGARVLDLGCGSGVPMARALDRAGHRVTGVDISEVQVRRAREAVPGAEFVRADATELDFADGSFDAAVSLYALIHIPLAEQPPLLARLGRWIRPGGTLLAVTGHTAYTGTDDDWLGGGAPMWWSHADAATYRTWLREAGFAVDREEFVPEGDGGAALFWARRTGRT